MLHSTPVSLIVERLIEIKGIYDRGDTFFIGCSLGAGFMVE
jgi:hypothetical protein